MVTSIVLVLTQKLGEAQHSITHKFNYTDTNKSMQVCQLFKTDMRNRSTSNASEESFKYVNILDLHWYVLGFSAMVVGDRLQENAFH